MVSVNFLRNIWGVLLGGHIVAVLVDFTAAAHPSTFHSSLTRRVIAAVVFALPVLASPVSSGPDALAAADALTTAGGVAAGSSDENHFPDRQQGFEILVCCISF